MSLESDLMQFAKLQLSNKIRKTKIDTSTKEKSGFTRQLNQHIAQIANAVSQLIRDGIDEGETENKLKSDIVDLIQTRALSKAFFDSIDDTSKGMTLDEIIDVLGIADIDEAIEKLKKLFPGKALDSVISSNEIAENRKKLQALRQEFSDEIQDEKRPVEVKTKSFWYKTFVQMTLGILSKEIQANPRLKSYFSLDSLTRGAVTNISTLDKIVRVVGSEENETNKTIVNTLSLKIPVSLESKAGFLRKVKKLTITISLDFSEIKLGSKTSFSVEISGIKSDEYFIPSRKLKLESNDLLDMCSEAVDDLFIPALISLRNKDVFKEL